MNRPDIKEDVININNAAKLEMVLIPPGTFLMGDPLANTKPHGVGNEMQHKVTITKPFYLGKYVVTETQWLAVMSGYIDPEPEEFPEDTGWGFHLNDSDQWVEDAPRDRGPTYYGPEKANISELNHNCKQLKFPIVGVCWEACQKFIKRLNAVTKGGFRLPTESEWEYACRAGGQSVYSVGENITPIDANFIASKTNGPVMVDNYKPNNFGLYGMHGNVFEWCHDWYGSYPAGPIIDGKGPSEKKAVRMQEDDGFPEWDISYTFHVRRGGSFKSNPENIASYSRNFPDTAYNSIAAETSFRLARTVFV